MAICMRRLQPKLLARAVEIAGSEGMLCTILGVDPHRLRLWLSGRATVPADELHRVIDLILEDDIARAAQDRRSHPRMVGALIEH